MMAGPAQLRDWRDRLVALKTILRTGTATLSYALSSLAYISKLRYIQERALAS